MVEKTGIKLEEKKDKRQRKETKKAEIEYIKKKAKEAKYKQDKTITLRDRLKKRESEINLLKKENANLKEERLRIIAEMENFRKRLEREKTEFYQYALSEFLKELFTVLDNFERALGSKDQGDDKSFRDGIEMIYKQYLDLLMKQGVIPIEIEGKKFNPHLHQALITEESEDIEEPEVVEELQRGYTLHNRLLRPALVKVVIPKKGK